MVAFNFFTLFVETTRNVSLLKEMSLPSDELGR